jgi:hypothetical protein
MALLDTSMAQVDRLRGGSVVADRRQRQDQRDISPQPRLVLLHDHDIIPALRDHRLRDVALGQERVHRHKTTVQDHVL